MTEILSIGGAVSPLNVRNSAQAVSAPEVSGSVRNESFISSRIRVDNLLDLAILEYRSQEGEVIRQFPTQGQIQAFQRAAELDNRNVTAEDSSFTPVNTNDGATTTTTQSGTTTGAAFFAQDTATTEAAPAPQTSTSSVPAPAPVTTSNVSSFVSAPVSNATTPSTTQSVVV
ncbi:MAG: hypothetical protein HND56_10290 [Pseudomonadota bacterium]|nr:hypothetical protein [Pseudomonadota bacterium]QKK06053.1 MAG: hypothetical protein HND56_10290 [Pseudomonadota bacterium]